MIAVRYFDATKLGKDRRAKVSVRLRDNFVASITYSFFCVHNTLWLFVERVVVRGLIPTSPRLRQIPNFSKFSKRAFPSWTTSSISDRQIINLSKLIALEQRLSSGIDKLPACDLLSSGCEQHVAPLCCHQHLSSPGGALLTPE